MKTRDVFLAVLVVAVWGVNFVLIRVALNGVPPLLLCALRFFLAAFPAVFFIRRPAAPLRILIGYGLAYFALQFGFLFTAIHLGVSAGLASLVLQIQVFFTMGLSLVFFKDIPNVWKIAGALIAFSGIALVGTHVSQDMNLVGLLLLLVAALSFAGGNLVSRFTAGASPLALVVWGSLVAFPFLAGLSWILEGPERIGVALGTLSWPSIGAVAYIVYLSTHLGFTIWSTLLAKYSASTIAPFTLLVPVFGFVSSAVFLGEALTEWKIAAAVLVVSGLALNVWGARFSRVSFQTKI